MNTAMLSGNTDGAEADNLFTTFPFCNSRTNGAIGGHVHLAF